MKYSLRTFENILLFAFLFYTAIISGVSRALSQGGKLSWKGPTGQCTGPTTTSQHWEETWETMVNPDVDSYAKTWNHRKVIWKTQNNNNLLKTKGILKPKYHLRWRSGFHI